MAPRRPCACSRVSNARPPSYCSCAQAGLRSSSAISCWRSRSGLSFPTTSRRPSGPAIRTSTEFFTEYGGCGVRSQHVCFRTSSHGDRSASSAIATRQFGSSSRSGSKQGHGSADGGGQWIRAAIQPSRRCCTTRSRGCPVRQAIVSRSQPNRQPAITTADRAGGHDKSMQLIGQPPPNPSPHPKCYGGLCPLAPAGELKR